MQLSNETREKLDSLRREYADECNATQKRRRIITVIVIAIVVAIPLLVDQPFYRNIMTLIFLWGAMAGAWNILGGYAGRFSLGNAVFFGTGAYTSSILFTKFGISPWIGMVAGVGVSVVLALFLGFITLRLRGIFFTLCTIAVLSLFEILATHFRPLTGGSEGMLLPFTPSPGNMVFESDLTWAYVMLFFMLVVYFLTRWFSSNALGYRWLALRENQDAAEALGINTLSAKLSAFVVSAVLTSIGGTLYAQYALFIEPVYVYSMELSTQFALYAIIGGMGTPLGPILGAAVITPLSIILRSSLPQLASGASMLLYAIILIIAALFFPQGFMQLFRRIRKRPRKGQNQRQGGTEQDGRTASADAVAGEQ